MDIEDLLGAYPAERIEAAAKECDFTVIEIMDEVAKLRRNLSVPYPQRAQHLYNCINEMLDAIEDFLREEDEEMNECIHCHGSGGGEDAALHCPYCKGTGKRVVH